MKVKSLYTIIFSFLFNFFEIVLQPFLILKKISILLKTKNIQLNIFWFISKRNSDQLMQKLSLNSNCMIIFRKTYFFNPQFQLGFHQIF
jgi:hypothetical protein